MSFVFRISKSLLSNSNSNNNSNGNNNNNNDDDNQSDNIDTKPIYDEDEFVAMPHNIHRPLVWKYKNVSNDNNNNANNTNKNNIIGISVDPLLQTEVYLNYISSLLSKLSIEQQNSLVQYNNVITPLSNMTYMDIGYNISSLRLERIQRIMRPQILKLMQHAKNSNAFNEPVDPVALGIPHYFTKVKNPMDLGTVRLRLQNKYYCSLQSVIDDVRLVFNNAISFNPSDHGVHKAAVVLLNEFDADVKALEEKFFRDAERKAKHACSQCQNNHCILCGEKCLKLEPPTLCCQGTCYQRIKRDSVYYVSVDGILVWCFKCYNGLPHVVCQQPPRPPLLKRQLLKRKLDEEIVERWIKCACCHQHVHQICAHYNSTINDEETGEYYCPLCQLELKSLEASKSNITPNPVDIMKILKSTINNSNATTNVYDNHGSESSNGKRGRDNGGQINRKLLSPLKSCWSAKSLPRTNLSDFLECMVTERLKSTGFGDIASGITIRMTYNNYQTMEVPTPIIANLMTEEKDIIPRFLKYKQKCILMFQNVDGIDLCLFCMYANEFDEECPPPNKSVIYIAYLDSVDFFQPVKARTLVYHEIMVGYLKWAQCRGFKQGHIWSCPPQRGDNFIFWCHPMHQRTPQRDRLNAWYNAILRRALTLGFIDDINTLWDIYFAKYNKKGRDQVRHRMAAKNNSLMLVKAETSTTTNSNTITTPNDNSNSNNSLDSMNTCKDSDGNDSFDVPISPPLFEGDFWVNECVRIHRSLYTRAKSSDGLDASTNLRKVKEILKQLMLSPLSAAFNEPVDPVALQIPTYFNIIKNPMDLGTIKGKLKDDEYATIYDFACDVRLVFKNSITFNSPAHHVYMSAVGLGDVFENSLLDLVTDIVGELANKENMDTYLMAYPLRTFDLPPACLPSARIGLEMTIESNINNMTSNSSNLVTSQSSSSIYGSNSINKNNNNTNTKSSEKNLGYIDSNDGNDSESMDTNLNENDCVGEERALCRVESLVSSLYPADMRERDTGGAADLRYTNFNNNFNNNYNNNSNTSSTFSKPQLAKRALVALMNELAKGVERIKDSLFVLQFSDSNGDSKDKKNKVDNLVEDKSDSTTAESNQKPKSRMKLKISSRNIYNISHNENDSITAESCLKLLGKLKNDTSDPDGEILSPFVESRHTFLEMCQFRRYQFDTLRRVKYSSLMLLYHLHNPTAPYLRPKCIECKSNIIDVRWHCSNCDNYDICSMCYDQKVHNHPLSPHRVSFY